MVPFHIENKDKKCKCKTHTKQISFYRIWQEWKTNWILIKFVTPLIKALFYTKGQEKGLFFTDNFFLNIRCSIILTKKQSSDEKYCIFAIWENRSSLLIISCHFFWTIPREIRVYSRRKKRKRKQKKNSDEKFSIVLSGNRLWFR